MTLLLVVVLGTGCNGSDDTGARQPTTKELAAGISKQLVSSKFLDKSASDCVANKVAPKLSTKGQELSRNVGAVTGLSKSDQAALLKALDACVSVKQFADIVAQATGGVMSGDTTGGTVGSTLGGPTPLTSCISDKLAAAYPTSGEMFEALLGKEGESAILSMLTACGLPGVPQATTG